MVLLLFGPGGSSYTVTAEFQNASQLVKGNPVKVAGVAAGSIKEIRKFYAQIPEPKELATIEDANHLFEGKTSLVGEAVEDLLADFNTVRT